MADKTVDDYRVFEKAADIVHNAMLERTRLLDKIMDPRRDIEDECGHVKVERITAEQYRSMYDKLGIAERVVNIFPDECWKVSPSIYEDEDSDTETPFELAWKEMCNELRGKSLFQDEVGNPLWDYLKKADIKSQIGHYGIILLGIDDGLDLSESVATINPQTGDFKGTNSPTRKLIYLRVFDESEAPIAAYETDETSPRFGMPVSYNITFNSMMSDSVSATSVPSLTKTVHWTRVIHIADGDLMHSPVMQSVFHNLQDCLKLYGGSAEMYWRGAFPGLSIESHPQLMGEVDVDVAALRESMEQYMNGLQRYIQSIGLAVKSLAPQVVDPTAQIDVQIEAICIKLGIPKRIFTGSERGELASSQDSNTWDDRLRGRQNNYVTPKIVVPLVDRLIGAEVLPIPVGFSCVWPVLGEDDPNLQSTIAERRTKALALFVSSGLEAIITPLDFFNRVLGYDLEEAQSIVDAAEENVADGTTMSLPDPDLAPVVPPFQGGF